MADGFYVPIDTNAIPSNINAYIAQGPQGWAQTIGDLGQDYQQGKDWAYQNKQRSLFQGDPSQWTNPDGSLNYQKMGQMLLQSGGAAAVDPATKLMYAGYQYNLQNQPQPNFSGSQDANPRQPGAQTPQAAYGSSSQQGAPQTSPPSSSSSTPNNGQQPAAAAPSGGPAVITPRAIALKQGSDPEALAQWLGQGVDDPLTPDSVARLRAGQQAGATAPSGQQGAGNQSGAVASAAPAGAPAPSSLPPSTSRPGPPAGPAPAPGPGGPAVTPAPGTPAAPAPNSATNPPPMQPGVPQVTGNPSPGFAQPRGTIPNESPQETGERNAADYWSWMASKAASIPGNAEQAKIFQDRSAQHRATYQSLLENRLNTSKLTSEQQNYQSGTSAGVETQKQAIDRSNVVYSAMQGEAQGYQSGLKPYLTLARSLLNSGIYTGAAGDWSQVVNKYRAAFGDTNAALLQEALSKVTANSVLAQINNQRFELNEGGGKAGGKIFQSQVEKVEQASPSITTTPAGNRFLVEVAGRMGELKSKLADMQQDYLTSGHLYLDPAFDQKTAQYLKDHPIFTPEEMAHPELLGAYAAPDGMTKLDQNYKQWAQTAGIPANAPLRITVPGGGYKYIHAPDPNAPAAGAAGAAPAAPAAPAQPAAQL